MGDNTVGGFFHSYHNTATSIIDSFRFKEPFAIFLKNYFRRNKKFGSRDRKIISDLCYGFWRIGGSCDELDFNDAMGIGYYLTHEVDKGYLKWLNSPLVDPETTDLEHKIRKVSEIYAKFSPHLLFPEMGSVMPEIDRSRWISHHLKQPPFFIRIRPGKKPIFEQLLNTGNLSAKWVADDAICIDSNVKLPDNVTPDLDFVVQDISSQQTFSLLSKTSKKFGTVWDACAGSGGKTLMAADNFPNAQIFASDIREEILQELRRRAGVAGIEKLKLFCTDLTHPMSAAVVRSNLPAVGVDLIIADVPCTGSGTWTRSPEWLQAMDYQSILEFQKTQKSILEKLPMHLKKGGYLLYITCSVYMEENTAIVDFIIKNTALQLVESQLLSGISQGGDQLYAALFTLPA